MTRSFMAEEIDEIPDVARRLLSGADMSTRDAAAALRQADPRLLVTVARGSSDHAAAYLKYVVELHAGLPVASVGPSIASIYRRGLDLSGAACVGISQSGQSPDIVDMARAARGAGALTLAMTNDLDSPLAAAADHAIALRAGPERSVAATKTFVASLVAGLALVADWRRIGPLSEALAELPEVLSRALALDWSPLGARLAEARSLYVLGRGPGYAVACEAALKAKETCGLQAEAYSAAEVLHGPSAIVRQNFPVLALAVDDESLPQMLGTVERLVAQGADVFVTGHDVPGAITLPAVTAPHAAISPVAQIVGWYRCVEDLSRRRGFDPDRPPHLRKVTETV